MSEWKKVKLGEICERVTSGGTPKANVSSYYNPPTIPWLNTKEINYCRITKTENYISEEGFNNSSAKWIVQDSVIVAMYGNTAGKVAINKIPLTTNQACCNLAIDKQKADYEFVYYQLCTLYGKMVSLKIGAAQLNLNAQIIKNLAILLPPLSTQHHIATILSRYDSLIENYQKQIKLLEEAAQRLYKEWFVDLHFPGHENTKIVDGVPEGWEKKKVKEVCDTTSGGTPSRSKTEFYTGDILWVKTKELNDDFIFDTEEKITEDAIRNSSAKMVPSGSILMAMYGATIGKLGIATKELSCNQACCVFLLPEDSTLRLYLYNWLLNSRTLLISMGKGAAQPNLSQDMIKNLEVVVPSSCLLAKFDSKVKPLYRIMSYHSSQIRLLTEARDRLLPKLMSGDIEI